MTEILIDTGDLVAYTARLQSTRGQLEREFKTAMIRSTAALQNEVQANTPWATGTLRRSITTDPTPYLGTVGTNVPYAPVVEYGRRPGAAMPPAGSLLRWMKSKQIDPQYEFVIRRAIARRGIPARNMFRNAFEKLQPDVVAEFQAALTRFVQAVR